MFFFEMCSGTPSLSVRYLAPETKPFLGAFAPTGQMLIKIDI
jgi:hypothetical protein